MTVATKKRTKGGETASVSARNRAARIQADDIRSATDGTAVGNTTDGEPPDATDAIIAIQTQQRGDDFFENDVTHAPPKQRRTMTRVKTIVSVSGEASDDPCHDTELGGVARTNKADGDVKSATVGVTAVCQQLRELQRRRAAALKSRIMIENRLVSLVAQEYGYHAALEEKERKGFFDLARKCIKQIESGDEKTTDLVTRRVSALVKSNQLSSQGFDAYVGQCEKEIIKLAKTLPVAAWVQTPECNGFGIKSLGIVIGECGDLWNYANPAKLWKRMGCAPYNGKMPSTWRSSKPSLTALEWTELGYSPWRRSVAWVIGDCLVKANKTGPYRVRYDEAKASAKEKHPDWTDGHAHNHAMLLCVKRLLRDLWVEWRKDRTP